MSIVYEARCTDCLGELTVAAKLDASEDLCLKVEPCKNCIATADSNGYSRGQKDAE